MGYLAPRSIEEALEAIKAGGVSIVAGGTDFYPALQDRPPRATIVDIARISGLRGISRGPEGLRIGAATTWTDILRADLPPAFNGLKAAAREVGSIQIQNAATLGGNLCNASPAADGVPPLLTLEAEVEITGGEGIRRINLADFILGPRRVDLRPGELMTALVIPALPPNAHSSFLKLGARKYLVISIIMVSTLITLDDEGRIAQARVAVGACSAIAQRLPALETALIGLNLANIVTENPIIEAHLAPLSPIDDMRGSSPYRMEAAAILLHRALIEACEKASAHYG